MADEQKKPVADGIDKDKKQEKKYISIDQLLANNKAWAHKQVERNPSFFKGKSFSASCTNCFRVGSSTKTANLVDRLFWFQGSFESNFEATTWTSFHTPKYRKCRPTHWFELSFSNFLCCWSSQSQAHHCLWYSPSSDEFPKNKIWKRKKKVPLIPRQEFLLWPLFLSHTFRSLRLWRCGSCRIKQTIWSNW